MKAPSTTAIKATLFFLTVVAVVSIPFVIWGDEYVMPLMQSRQQQTGWLTVIAIVLLAADSVAPVPSTLVLMFLAAKAGRVAGIVGGTVGLSAGVLAAGWVGRAAVGRIAPKFFPDAELARMRANLQRNLTLTLACWRSVPVMAETSVIIAAAAGIPVRRIFWVTLLPNFVVSVIYSLAADDSFTTACIAFVGTLLVSLVMWQLLAKKAPPPGGDA